ncbi:probable disease resistance protein At4g27220 isoform X2 [Argentina anserina]|uniref:probable disease resistance protein At4g27220 isoform X2 n=1 Tax=Argentina anserina TaxID=57926 RepID=UPI0021768A9F|nr:probable disease resistance protein At4g27220 isoform X2 [Potentilla anserina]
MASSSQTASSSHLPSAFSSPPGWNKYDVFLSFRGEDTRRTIVSSLYHELRNREIEAFMDDTGLIRGTSISPILLAAIQESRSAIVVLSPNYADSKWCLDELAMIIQCMENNSTTVIPIFYDVLPHDVRHQRGSFAKAFTRHLERFAQEDDKLNQWRAALTKVAGLSGFESNKYSSDLELVRDIVETVCNELRPIDVQWALSSTGDFVAFEATRRAMNKVMRALQDDEITAIGVFGMGGVGKTSMVKHVGAQARKLGLVHHVIMAVVSQAPNLRNIQGTLADLLGLKLLEETVFGRAVRLMEKIMKGSRILIILDDIWERIDLSSIGIPSHDELQRCGSKIIFTTRRLSVCHTMESQEIIPLQVLSEEDAWNLFQKKARTPLHESTNLYGVARTVARECAGLPIAVIAVARALGDQDLDDWWEAAYRLKAGQPANYEDERDVFRCIKLSYDYLRPDDNNIAKSLFLLCCLFPEDFEIKVEDLLVYAIGIGLFQDAETIREARAKAHLVVKYLKASSLVLDSAYHGFVKMHDVIRDVAITISSEVGPRFFVKAGCELQSWPAIHNAHEGYSAISLMRNQIHKLPESLKVDIHDVNCLPPEVSSNPYWVNFDICIGWKEHMEQSYYGRFFERKLNVRLDAEWHLSRYLTLNTSIETLPDWFIHLVTEKTKMLEYIGCRNLENLLVDHDRGRLKVLQFLAVIECHMDVLMNSVHSEPVFESLIYLFLEGLYGLEKLCIGNLAPGSLCNLKLLNVRNCLELEDVLLTSNLLPMLQNLETLHCEYSKDVRVTKMEYVFDCAMLEPEEIILPKLREITLCYIMNLKGICYGHPPRGVFCNLNSLAIRGCQKLKYLFEYKVAQSLFQLELLWVEECSDLETVTETSWETKIMEEWPEFEAVTEASWLTINKLCFPKLKEIYLSSLPQLTWIQGSFECPSLEHLYVYKCPRLPDLVASDFQSKSHVKANDEGHFAIIFERLFHRQFNPEQIPQFFSKKESDFSVGSLM